MESPRQVDIDSLCKEELREVGKNIRIKREQNKWDILDLAFHSRLSEATVYKIEFGDHNPTWKTLSSIANALKVKVKDLL